MTERLAGRNGRTFLFSRFFCMEVIIVSKKYEIRLLSKQFYEDHPHKQFPQILVKKMRPYACWEIPDKPGTYLCVPFRSNMTSTDGFRFRNSTMNLDKHPHPGLDYRKAVIINNPEYFLDKKPVMCIIYVKVKSKGAIDNHG